MPELSGVLDLGAFALVSYFVVTHWKRQSEAQERTALILAELTVQVARLTGAKPDETREATRLLHEKKKGGVTA